MLGGTKIPLPNSHQTSGVMVDGTDTMFTVNKSGVYLIQYDVNLTAELLVGVRVTVNGFVGIPDSDIPPILTRSSFTNTMIVSLAAGDTLSLELYGTLGAATLLVGDGASLNIVLLKE